MPALLLQKPSKMSKSRERLDALERRLQVWERGEIKSLLLEAEDIQQRLRSNDDPKNIANVLKKFPKLMKKGNVNGVLKLSASSMTNGIFPIDEKTPYSLKRKHPQSQPAYEKTLINGESPVMHPIIFGDINEELVRKAAIRTKGGSSLSGLDANGRRKMLTSKVFGICTSDLRKAIADFIKHICIN